MAAMDLPSFAAAAVVGAIAGQRDRISVAIGRLRRRATARYCEWCFQLGKGFRKRFLRRSTRR
jgi:hypothetical protein